MVKNLLLGGILTLISLFGIQHNQVVFAQENTITKNESAMTEATEAIDDFWAFLEERYEDTSDQYYHDLDAIVKETEQRVGRAKESISTKDVSPETAAALEDIKVAMTHSQEAFRDIGKALAENDTRASDEAYIALNKSIDEYNKAYDQYSISEYGFTDAQYRIAYWIAAGLTATIALCSFVWAYHKNSQDRSKTKKAAGLRNQRKTIARDSLWPLGGGLITLGTYYFPIGDTYFVAWGVILFGLIFYGRSIAKYRKMSRS